MRRPPALLGASGEVDDLDELDVGVVVAVSGGGGVCLDAP